MTSKNGELVVVSNTPGWVLGDIKSRLTSGTDPLCDKQITKLSWACFPHSVIEEISLEVIVKVKRGTVVSPYPRFHFPRLQLSMVNLDQKILSGKLQK